MENNKEYENYGSGTSEFDKNHSSYRAYAFQKYMRLREKEFINNYRFEGDEDFTRIKQRATLKLAFRYNYSGVINLEKIVRSKLGNRMNNIINVLDIDLKKIIKDTDDTHVPVSVFPSMWNAEEQPVKGVGNTVPLHNIGKKIYDIDASNTAILTYDDNYSSGYWWWLLPAYIHAMGETVMKKRLSTLDAKLVNNKINNEQRGVNYDSVYDVDKSYIDLAPSQASITGNKDAAKIDIGKMLDTKLKKLDLSSGESINDLLQFIKDHEKNAFMEMGKRVNMEDQSGERSISMDFEAIESHWRLREKELEDMMNIFIENYKVVFGKELKLITTTQETLDDLRAREIEKAGHADGAKPEQTKEGN